MLRFFKGLSKRGSAARDREGGRRTEGESNNERWPNHAADIRRDEDASSGELGEILECLRERLTQFVSVEFGLLDELGVLGVVTPQQIGEIESHSTSESQVDRLLNFVVKMPNERQEQLLIALSKSQQTHVCEFIRARGDLSRMDRGSWPLHVCEEMTMIDRNWEKLIKLVDVKSGLLDELLSVGCLNDRQVRSVEAGETDIVRNTRLLQLFYHKSVADFDKFLSCLQRTKQSLVTSLLSTTCKWQPLSDVMKSRLTTKRVMLVEMIDIRPDLLTELRAVDCISRQQKQFIESAKSEKESIALLLDILTSGSESAFEKFLDSLKATGQEHVAGVLQRDGTVAFTVATTSCIAREQDLLIERFRDLLRNGNKQKRDKRFDDITQLVTKLVNSGIDVIETKSAQHDVAVFYWCHSFNALQHLKGLFTSGELKRILERIFTVLLNNEKQVLIDNLKWDVQNYTNGTQDCDPALNLKALSEPHKTKCEFRDFPIGVFELILNKTIGQLFVANHKRTPRDAAVYAMATLGGVSASWWWTLFSRQYNKLLLKRYFQSICSPFKCSPHRLHTLRVEYSVRCLTEFNGKLYVACYQSRVSIQVFGSAPPCGRLDDIAVLGLSDPVDMVVCRDKNQLYIADYVGIYGIWRVNLLFPQVVSRFVTSGECRPWRLSINSCRLLITTRDGNKLFLYDGDGNELKCIELPEYMAASHAVETTRNTYIVSHINRRPGDTKSEHNNVSEVDVEGKLIRQFYSRRIDAEPIQFSWPYYLALVGDRHVIVADLDNKRVVALNSDLQLKRVLMPSLDRQPRRLCFSNATGLLFISDFNEHNIDLYRVGVPTFLA